MHSFERSESDKKTIIKFGQRRNTKIFIEISKGRKRDKGDSETSGGKDESDETNSPEPVTPDAETSEGFSTVDLSPKHEAVPEETKSSRGDQFLVRLKNSSVGKLFKSETKDQDISIYTIDQSVRHPPDQEERIESNSFSVKLRKSSTQRPSEAVNQGRSRCIASQTNDYPPYRLYFLPSNDWRESDSKILKLISCQCALACFLIIWLLSGALTFYLTEGPYEEKLAEDLNAIENSTMVSMATDLRLLDPELDPWDDILIKYTLQHKEEIIASINQGYRNDTIIWTFPGSLLCAVSILTTLGLAAPLPQTTGGLIGGALFALLGVPIHIIFIVNLGRTIGTRVQLFAKDAEYKVSGLRQRIINVRRFGDNKKREMWPEQIFTSDFKPPAWLSYFPIISILVYYIIGFLVFGIARGLSTGAAFVFFLDFSRGYPSNGFSRMGYSWYLEGFAILTGLNIAILRDSPFKGLLHLALPYDLVTNSLD